jgi:hypothetical protein
VLAIARVRNILFFLFRPKDESLMRAFYNGMLQKKANSPKKQQRAATLDNKQRAG